MTGADCDLPPGCMATLGTVGSAGHEELAELMKSTRGGAYVVLSARLEQAVADGELPASVDITHLARYLQTVQSGMAIRARDGAERSELQAVAGIAMAGWDAIVQASAAEGPLRPPSTPAPPA